MSHAATRKCRAKAATSRRQLSLLPPTPCRKSTSSPCPARSSESPGAPGTRSCRGNDAAPDAISIGLRWREVLELLHRVERQVAHAVEADLRRERQHQRAAA